MIVAIVFYGEISSIGNKEKTLVSRIRAIKFGTFVENQW
jgi:hypothetical protein